MFALNKFVYQFIWFVFDSAYYPEIPMLETVANIQADNLQAAGHVEGFVPEDREITPTNQFGPEGFVKVQENHYSNAGMEMNLTMVSKDMLNNLTHVNCGTW